MEILIRDYEDADYIPLRKALEREGLFSLEYDSRKRVARKAEGESSFVLVARSEGGDFVGSIGGLVDHNDGRPSLFRLVVMPDFRQEGIGSELLGHAEKRLYSLGERKVRIFVDDANSFLKGWYRKRGYTEGGLKKEDEVSHRIMIKLLRKPRQGL